MTSDLPVAVVVQAPLRNSPSPAMRPRVTTASGSWRYETRRRSRVVILSSIAASLGLHAVILLGIGPPRPKAAPAAVEENNLIRLAIPDLKDLEEPEPVPTDNATPLDPGVLVPMQADLPQLPQPGDFVQQLNFASLIEKPDFSQIKIFVIPEHIRSGSGLAQQIGKIFNLADLDRIPEPVLEPAPQFPFAMRREALTGTVMVEFIVDTYGNVLDPIVRDSTHHGFDDAALAGVGRWKFRPGYKGGRKVNTRMRVPIVFKFADPLD